MDIRSIRKLIEIVEQSDIAEIEIKEGEHNIRISRSQPTVAVAAAPVVQPVAAPAAAPVATGTVVEANMADAAPVITGHQVASPMVGSFYSAPSPDSDPFVKVGDQVSEGDTLCIIEAMKIMNPIESDKTGVIKQILVQNAEPVEFGQALFIIE